MTIKSLSVLLLLTISLLACGPSTRGIEEQVKIGLSDKLSSDPMFKQYKMTVQSVSVIKKGGNEYDGIAKVSLDGQKYELPLRITASSEGTMFQVPMGGFAFLMQREMKRVESQLEQDRQRIEREVNDQIAKITGQAPQSNQREDTKKRIESNQQILGIASCAPNEKGPPVIFKDPSSSTEVLTGPVGTSWSLTVHSQERLGGRVFLRGHLVSPRGGAQPEIGYADPAHWDCIQRR